MNQENGKLPAFRMHNHVTNFYVLSETRVSKFKLQFSEASQLCTYQCTMCVCGAHLMGAESPRLVKVKASTFHPSPPPLSAISLTVSLEQKPNQTLALAHDSLSSCQAVTAWIGPATIRLSIL